jgi:DNA repair protein RecO (recombination protein O)
MAVVRDRALLLRRYPYSESSLVVHACTREHGRVHLIAKGVFRPTSRYYAALDYFDTLELEWDHNPERELSSLRAGLVLRRRRAISEDLAAFDAAMAVIELSDVASRPAHRDDALFDHLQSALDALASLAGRESIESREPRESRESSDSSAASGAARADLVQVWFELAFLDHVGLQISLAGCASCGGAAPALHERRAAFSAAAGGRLCEACAKACRASGLRVGTMPVEVLDDARAILAAHGGAKLARDQSDRVRDLVERFLDYHLETRVRMHRAFLASPNRNARRSSSPAR